MSSKPVSAIATIRYRFRGVENTWEVGAFLPDDNQETMKEHLRNWLPEADFLGVTFEKAKRKKLNGQQKENEEINQARLLFTSRLNKVCDGSVYTASRMQEIFGGVSKTAVEEFVRMCRIHPFVEVHKKYLRNKPTQFTFHKSAAISASDRIIELANEITRDMNSSLRSKEAASTIILLLGGQPCTTPSSSP